MTLGWSPRPLSSVLGFSLFQPSADVTLLDDMLKIQLRKRDPSCLKTETQPVWYSHDAAKLSSARGGPEVRCPRPGVQPGQLSLTIWGPVLTASTVLRIVELHPFI